MERFVGVDVGAETVKLAEIVRKDDGLYVDRHELVAHGKNPGRSVIEVLSGWDWDSVSSAVATGRLGRQCALYRIPTKQAFVEGVRFVYGDVPATVVSIGSPGLSAIELRATGEPVYRASSRCAQGTGNFLRQRSPMISVLVSLLQTLRGLAQSRAALHLEVLALRHQLQVLQRTRPRRLRLATADRWLWVWLSRVWTAWRTALVIVKSETVIAWHRHAFRLAWTCKSRRRTGRPAVPRDVQTLIRTMSRANPLWGAPRIHGEPLKLGIAVSQATVAKYMGHDRQPPSQTWRTFLANHIGQVVAADSFVVPTATCRLLFVLVLVAHERRRVVHVAVTDHPTAAWTAQQLREAFPWDQAPRYLLRDRDHAFDGWEETAKTMGIDELLTAPRSPWQNPFAERVIGSLRRECLDHVIVWSERSLHRHLGQYLTYYHAWRTHLSLDKDAPVPRPVQPPMCGAVVQVPHLGGLHHHYERRAA